MSDVKLKVKAEYEIKVVDDKGRVEKEVKDVSHTFNKNFAHIARMLLFPRGDQLEVVRVKDWRGIDYELRAPDPSNPLSYNPGASTGKDFMPTAKLSIVISGDLPGPPDRTFYNIPSTFVKVLPYEVYDWSDDGAGVKITVSASWRNTGSSSEFIHHLGLLIPYLGGSYVESPTGITGILISIDTLPSPVEVPSGRTLIASYTIYIPF